MKKKEVIISLILIMWYYLANNTAPLVLSAATQIFLTKTAVIYDDFNFTKAFFNQYSTLLNYDLKLYYPTGLTTGNKETTRNNAFRYKLNSGSTEYFTDWTYEGDDYSTGSLDSTWKGYVNDALFGRDFGSNGKANTYPQIVIYKINIGATTVDDFIELEINSAIEFRISAVQMLLAWSYTSCTSGCTNIQFLKFYNDDTLLGSFDLDYFTTTQAMNTYSYTIPQIFTNVNKIKFIITLNDTSGTSNIYYTLSEFNLFSENAISVPDNASDTTFGLSYKQVEWWDILGHFNNFGWWVVNQSFLSPFFIWIDDYILVFISKTIEFIIEVFGL